MLCMKKSSAKFLFIFLFTTLTKADNHVIINVSKGTSKEMEVAQMRIEIGDLVEYEDGTLVYVNKGDVENFNYDSIKRIWMSNFTNPNIDYDSKSLLFTCKGEEVTDPINWNYVCNDTPVIVTDYTGKDYYYHFKKYNERHNTIELWANGTCSATSEGQYVSVAAQYVRMGDIAFTPIYTLSFATCDGVVTRAVKQFDNSKQIVPYNVYLCYESGKTAWSHNKNAVDEVYVESALVHNVNSKKSRKRRWFK